MLLTVLVGASCKDSSHRRRAHLVAGVLFINEVVAAANRDVPGSSAILLDDNGDPILDEDGEAVDWIEIYNLSSAVARLRGVFLSNDPGNRRLFGFPKKMTIDPGGFVIVICDGRPELGPLHASFKLDPAGETIVMSTAKKGEITLDERRWVNLPADLSVGRYPDGEGDDGIIYVPTPGDHNKPVGVRLPRIDGAAGLGPVGPNPVDLTPLTLAVLEDRELLDGTVEILEVEGCGTTGDPDAQYLGPFPFSLVPDLTVPLTEQRRNHLDEPIEVSMSRFLLLTTLPHFDEGVVLRLRLRLQNVMGEVREEQCRVVVGLEPQVLDFEDVGGVEESCPALGEGARVFVFLRAAAGSAEDLEVELTYTAAGTVAATIDRRSGLELVEADACFRECSSLEEIAATQLFRVVATVPPQPAGTLVTFSFGARDPSRGEVAETENSSFRYVTGFDAPPVVFNEVLPLNETVLRDVYPPAVRDDPAFWPPDFAELYNLGDAPVDVGGMFLGGGRDRVCSVDGSTCPDELELDGHGFRIPEGVVIPPGGFLLFFFVKDADLNTAPDLEGAGLEGKTVLVVNSIELDDCHGSLFLLAGDPQGNCPVTGFDWDFRASAGNPGCVAGDLSPDRPLGLLPDGVEGSWTLDVPTPGVSNCLPMDLELVGEVAAEIKGGSGDCLDPDTGSVAFGWRLLVEWREFLLHGDNRGVAAVEVFAGDQSAPDEQVGSRSTVTVVDGEPRVDVGSQSCRLLLEADVDSVGVPAGFTGSEVSYRIRVTDTLGGSLALGPFVFQLCSQDGHFVRGDANLDLHLNVTDLVWINSVIFGIFPTQPCMDALDADDDGTVDQEDFFRLANFLFRRGEVLLAPFPLPGPDPTPDDLQCFAGATATRGLGFVKDGR